MSWLGMHEMKKPQEGSFTQKTNLNKSKGVNENLIHSEDKCKFIYKSKGVNENLKFGI